MSGESPSDGGVGFFGLLAIVFITLKLTNYINWSWWWVTAPLWGPLALVIVVLGITLAVAVLVEMHQQRKPKR